MHRLMLVVFAVGFLISASLWASERAGHRQDQLRLAELREQAAVREKKVSKVVVLADPVPSTLTAPSTAEKIVLALAFAALGIKPKAELLLPDDVIAEPPSLGDELYDFIERKDRSLRLVQEVALFVELTQEETEELLKNGAVDRFAEDEAKESVLRKIIGDRKYERFSSEREKIQTFNYAQKEEERRLVLRRRFALDPEQETAVVRALQIAANSEGWDFQEKRKLMETELQGRIPEEKLQRLLDCQRKYSSPACDLYSWMSFEGGKL